jgi:predicted DNA-binding transcriptional regulator YafY
MYFCVRRIMSFYNAWQHFGETMEADQAARIVRILMWLSAGNSGSLQVIRQMLEEREAERDSVHDRSLQRDLKIIENSGVKLHRRRDGNSVIYSIDKKSGAYVGSNTTNNELFSKHLLKSTLPVLQKSTAFEAADALMRQIETEAPGEVLPSNDLMESISLGHYTGEINDAILTRIIQVISNKEWIRIEYKDGKRNSPMFPCRIVPYLGRLYLITFDAVERDYRVFMIDQINKVVVIRNPPEGPHRFSLREFMKYRFGLWSSKDKKQVNIHVRITKPKLAQTFSKQFWHPEQTFEFSDDGSLDIYIRCGLSPELISWVLHWAPDIVVVGPNELKDQVAARATELLDTLQ